MFVSRSRAADALFGDEHSMPRERTSGAEKQVIPVGCSYETNASRCAVTKTSPRSVCKSDGCTSATCEQFVPFVELQPVTFSA